MLSIFPEKNRVLKLRFLAFPEGPGGFRKVRKADRNHFHRSWYLLVPGVHKIQILIRDLLEEFVHLSSARFSLKKLGLDSMFTSWDLRNRIPRRKLPI